MAAKKRGIILVLDSLGIGASDDAIKYGDVGSNTLGRIVDACAKGEADIEGLRSGPLHIPFFEQAGLLHALAASDDRYTAPDASASQAWGFAEEKSAGKDTPSGHWEMAGVPVMEDWGFFPKTVPCFPETLIQQFIKEAQLPGILGNCHGQLSPLFQPKGA